MNVNPNGPSGSKGDPASEAMPSSSSGLRQSRRWPPNWPIRWKLSAVSAGLTFLLLVVFSGVVGTRATDLLRENYSTETMSKAKDISQNVRVATIQSAAYIGPPKNIGSVIDSVKGPVQVLSGEGTLYAANSPVDLGPVMMTTNVARFGSLEVATVPIFDGQTPPVPVGWVRYGRAVDRLDASVGQVHFTILFGIIAATLLAAIGAVLLSRRALRPISTLTSTAREIAETRDPEVRLDPPVSDDEVAELTRTFSDMLHELSLSRAEEERLLKRQREFVADASHELRTPLTSVLANLELLEETLGRDQRPDDLDAVESALRSSRRMRRLVADLQLLARIDALRETTFGPCDFSLTVREAANEMEPLLSERTMKLSADTPAPVQGIEDELHRIVVNLIGNAIRHSPDGSRIEVAVTRDKTHTTLRVDDDGTGVPPELRTEIFDRFVRGSGPLDRSKGKGTGLGLSIVKAIAERHGGSVAVGESDLGGARFTVTLPIDQRPRDRSRPQPATRAIP